MLRLFGFLTTMMFCISQVSGREKHSHLDIYLTPESFLRGYEFVDMALKMAAKYFNEYPSKHEWIMPDEVENELKTIIPENIDSPKPVKDEYTILSSVKNAFISFKDTISSKMTESIDVPLKEIVNESIDNLKIVEIYHDKYDLHPPQILGPHSLRIRTPALSMFLESHAYFLGKDHYFGCQIHSLIAQTDVTFLIGNEGKLAVNLENAGFNYEKVQITSKDAFEQIWIAILNNTFIKDKIIEYIQKKSFKDLAVQMLNNIYTYEFEKTKEKQPEPTLSAESDNLKLQFGITELPHFYTTHASEIFHFSVTFDQLKTQPIDLSEVSPKETQIKAQDTPRVVEKRITRMKNFESTNTNYSEDFDEFMNEVGLNSFKEPYGANQEPLQNSSSK